MHRQVTALGQELPQQAIGVLASATLPGAVRVAEVHPDIRRPGQLAMAGHLLALVISQGLAQGRCDHVQLGRKGRQGTLGARIGHLAQQHQARTALHQHAHGRLVTRALDQVTLQCPGMIRSCTSGGRT